MKDKTIVLSSESATKRLAEALAKALQPRDVVFLKGTLGAGKTTFARYFIQSLSPLGDKEEVPSPTFTLAQSYPGLSVPVWHFDLYRIESTDELWELGLEEALALGITLIEWPEKLEGSSLHLNPKLILDFKTLANLNHHSVKMNTGDPVLLKMMTHK